MTANCIQPKKEAVVIEEKSVEKELDSSISSGDSVPEKPAPSCVKMSEAEQAPVEENDSQDDKEITSLPARRSYKYDDPPVVFTDVDVRMCNRFDC